MLVNMIKHSVGTHARLSFANHKSLKIQYSDNGEITPEQNLRKNGLKFMENRILSVKGSLTFGNGQEKGFHISVELPV